MAKGRYLRLGTGLIAGGAAFMALGLWVLSAVHWVPGIRGGNAGFCVIGAVMLIAGVMVLLGY